LRFETTKSLEIYYLFNTKRIHFKIVRQRTKTTQRQRVSRFESGDYWTCCWRVALVSTRLRSCYRRTFWTHAVINMMWC